MALTHQPPEKAELEPHHRALIHNALAEFSDSHKRDIMGNDTLETLSAAHLHGKELPLYLINPLLSVSSCHLIFDAIEVVAFDQRSHNITITPISVSPNIVISRSDRLSLSIVSHLIQKHLPHIRISHCKILHQGSVLPSRFSLSTYLRPAKRTLQQLLALHDNPAQPRYYRNNHCKLCCFNALCMRELVSKDDLSLLGSISPKEVDKLNNRGIFAITQLSYTFRPRKPRKNAGQAARPLYPLKALALREKKTFILDLPKLPTSQAELFFDFEGLPDERCIYLIGMNGTV